MPNISGVLKNQVPYGAKGKRWIKSYFKTMPNDVRAIWTPLTTDDGKSFVQFDFVENPLADKTSEYMIRIDMEQAKSFINAFERAFPELAPNRTLYTSFQLRTSQLWSTLRYAASKKQLVTYTEIQSYTGIPQHNTDQCLAAIAEHCKQKKYPALTSIVVSKENYRPTDSEIAKLIPDEWGKTFDFDWNIQDVNQGWMDVKWQEHLSNFKY